MILSVVKKEMAFNANIQAWKLSYRGDWLTVSLI